MKTHTYVSVMAALLGTVAVASAQGRAGQTLVVTSSNASTNELLVYNASDQLLQSIPTGGNGGVSGNAGGIAFSSGLLAVVNYKSQNVSIFEASRDGFQFKQIVPAESSPVSVAFGNHHLYILGTAKVESHEVFEFGVGSGADGVAGLLKADGSAAQVGVVENQLIFTEKSNAIETVGLGEKGQIAGEARMVNDIPENVNAPFGLVTRGNDAYVTIAHANEISLVRNDTVVTITGSGTQSAPCWLTLDGPYLFSANSPSLSVSRYVVYGQKIIQQVAVAASFKGDPTDIAYRRGVLAVVDGAGPVSHLSIFKVDGDGNLTLKGVATINSMANGVVVIHPED